MLRSKRKGSEDPATGATDEPLPPPSDPPVVATQPGVLAPPAAPDTSQRAPVEPVVDDVAEAMPPPAPGGEPSTMLLAGLAVCFGAAASRRKR